MRFAGKIYGSEKDYWVCAGFMSGNEESDFPREQEKRGTGVNALVYWVADSLLGDWIQLPEARPEHIIASRMIKHVITGDLNSSIDSNPPFPGKERHFLRAQLSRIFTATAIVPKGLYEIDEETNEMKLAEEFGMPGTEELRSLEAWGNLLPVILKVGRTTHIEPVGMAEEEKEEYMAKLGDEDKTEERFRGINEHNPMPGLETSWISRVCGDLQQYN